MKRGGKGIAQVFGLCILLFQFSCVTYYQQQYIFQNSFAAGDLTEAKQFLEKNKKAATKKDRLLYFMDRGVVTQMLGEYEESNEYFEQAYRFIEDNRKANLAYDALASFTNPMVKPYYGEDFEVVLIHYYKVINYLQLNDPSAALVECRRINTKLDALNYRYGEKKNRYRQDAFGHLLMGIIYDAQADYNNAFIAYRNAYETYDELYADEFGLQAPEQLKRDLLRAAARTGFNEELRQYEKLFGMQYQADTTSAEAVVFWANGLGPVKSEWSVNFSVIKGSGGLITFANEEEGFSFPFFDAYDENSEDGDGGLGDLKLVRVAFPKYLSRPPVKQAARIQLNGNSYPLEMVEDVEAIALSTLQDRMLRELGKSMLRLALKQASEEALREKNQDLGAVLSLANAFTEKADTRNWQTLPNSFSYSRVPLSRDDQEIQLISQSREFGADTVHFPVDLSQRSTLFYTFHSLDSYPPTESN